MSNGSTTANYRPGASLPALGALLALIALAPAAAPAETVDEVVGRLVAEAEAANLELVGAEAGVAQRLAVLDQARARFLPSLDLGLRYSVADGGREIDIPVGDLLNPVYASLNSLLEANGQPAPFAPVDNVSVPFLREREQETVLRLTQPLYDSRIPAAARAAEYDFLASRQGFDALRLRLRRDVQQAYLRWLATRDTKAILEASLEAARENQRVNESLYRNGRVTRDLVLRAEADVLEIEQQIEATEGASRIARNYVNLLRNAGLEAPLPEALVTDADVARLRDALVVRAGSVARDRGWLQDTAVERRYELRQIDSGLEAAAAAEDVARAAFKPQLALAVDAGVQGEEFGFSEDDRFVLASLVLRFNFFRGGADRAALRGARARSDELRAARGRAEQQIRLEVLEAVKDFEVAEASLRTAAKRVEAAEGAFEIARRKRDLGQIPPVEFIDSRRALTSAQLSQQVNRFQALAALAAVEYAVGGPPRTAGQGGESP
jgi:outer membrane protein